MKSSRGPIMHIAIPKEMPRQGPNLGRQVVAHVQGTSEVIRGRVIRDDAAPPWKVVVLLEDERVVSAEDWRGLQWVDRGDPC